MAKSKNNKTLRTPIIPKDWVMKELGQLFDFKNGINASKEDYGNGVKFINVMEVIYHNCITADMIPGSVKISKKQMDDFNVKRGDVLFNRTSETTNEIGLAAVYQDDEKVVFGGFVIRGTSKDKAIFDDYKKYCFHSKFVRDQIIKVGQGAVRTNIGQGDLEKVKLLLPKLPEQKAIAHILTLMDTAIKKNAELISKKKLYKEWLTEKLLTGKKRLKGFHREWKEYSLKNICKLIKDGTHGTHKEVENGIPLLSAKDINHGSIYIPENCRKISVEDYNQIHRNYEILVGDIVVTIVGTIGRTSIVQQNHTPFTFQRSVAIFRLNEKAIPEYIYQVFSSKFFIHILNKKANASAQSGVYLGELEKIKIKIPLIKEQTSIAKILQAVDTEIQLLKTKDEKLVEKKAGLMNVLLTGKERLKLINYAAK